MLPILHLNGYKIANPTVLARIPDEELLDLMRGYGHEPFLVSGGFDGEDPRAVHERFAAVLDVVLDRIAEIKAAAADGTLNERPRWPMIILRTPKGWTCPRVIDGVETRARSGPTRCRWRRDRHRAPAHPGGLDAVVPAAGAVRRGRRPRAAVTDLAPEGDRRMSANPVANGGLLRQPCACPTSATTAST